MAFAVPFRPSYVQLPSHFYARVAPTPVVQPQVLRVNRSLATDLGLDPDQLESPEAAGLLSGNQVPANADSIALAYAGHQFGHFVPQLGDGRAILIGEVIDRLGRRRDLQWKGTGRTPFSRGGDGRAALGPVLREYVVSEAMAALGIPSTRALAAIATGETVQRETNLPGAILLRVASSHVRVGTFQYFAARRDQQAVRTLADYVIQRHYPDAAGADNPYRALLEGVVTRQAQLIADWMRVGFIHGVMNTDNCSIVGETLDFGPCAFLDEFSPGAVFSSIDRDGRYAFGNQPTIARWNLARFAETLLPLLSTNDEAARESAMGAVDGFAGTFESAWLGQLRAKLGLLTALPGDGALAQELMAAMESGQADFTLTFRALCAAAVGPEGDAAVRARFSAPEPYQLWSVRWRERLALESIDPAVRLAAMRRANPAVVPRNHLVERMIRSAFAGDMKPFSGLVEAVASPFEDPPVHSAFLEPLPPRERVQQTFCGT